MFVQALASIMYFGLNCTHLRESGSSDDSSDSEGGEKMENRKIALEIELN